MTTAGLRPKLFGVLALTLLVAACAGDGTDNDATTQAPDAGQSSGSSTGGAGGIRVDRSDLNAPQPGTQDELDRLVGSRVYFGYDQYDLSSASQTVLRNQANWLRNNPGKRVLIAGHCDERGTTEYNIALGDRRAQSAKAFLVNLGVAESRLMTESKGEEFPVDPGQNEEAWTKNRRAHFTD